MYVSDKDSNPPATLTPAIKYKQLFLLPLCWFSRSESSSMKVPHLLTVVGGTLGIPDTILECLT